MTDTNQDPNYQDILNKYADSLKPTEETPTQNQVPSPQDQLESVPEPSVSVPEITPPPTMLEPDPAAEMLPDTEPQSAVMTEANSEAVNLSMETTPEASTNLDHKTTETIAKPPKDFSIPQPEVQIPPSMQDYVDSSKADKLENDIPSPSMASDSFVPPAPHPINIAPDIVPPKENHFFKYLFFFSLIIFIVVAALLAFSFYKTQKSTTEVKSVPTTVPPTGLPASKCVINGQEYDIGQSFPASDGCNTCSCDKDLLIACTTMACDASNSATPTNVTSTNTKNYSNSTFAFSLSYPNDFSLVDLLPKQFTKVSTTKEYLLLEDKNKTLAITIMVNPDGFGPIFSNKDYTLKYQTEKGLVSTIKSTNTPDENYDKNKDVYLYSGEISKDLNLIIMVQSSKDSTTNSQIVSQILSTFKLETSSTTPKTTIAP